MSRRTKDYDKINSVSKKRKRKKYIYIVIVLIPILFVAFNVLKWPIYNSLLNNYGLKTTAEVINEKNILGKGVITEMYTYSYKFNVNGKTYRGDSKDTKYIVGNKLEIEYLEILPEINRVIESGN